MLKLADKTRQEKTYSRSPGIAWCSCGPLLPFCCLRALHPLHTPHLFAALGPFHAHGCHRSLAACHARPFPGGWTARDWARIHTLVPGDEEARTVLKLLEARHRRRAARRRWKAVGRSLDAVFGLWAVVKERRYAPDGAGFEVAREHFESCREAMADGCQRSGEAMAAAPRAQ